MADVLLTAATALVLPVGCSSGAGSQMLRVRREIKRRSETFDA
ncbi:hypothetical protein [Burkholderia gladioli]|nr:hypothetical protein [Burkholderia gladioli]